VVVVVVITELAEQADQVAEALEQKREVLVQLFKEIKEGIKLEETMVLEVEVLL
jgi:hypothetical protein